MRRFQCVILSLAALLAVLASCKRSYPLRETTFLAMDTVMTLKIYGDADAVSDAEAKIGELERLLSTTDPASEIAVLNREGTGEVSAATAELISAALTLCERTDGALDITVYPVVRAWGFTTGSYRVPDEEELAAARGKVGYGRVTVSEKAVTVGDHGEIDLGSVAKGYAVDCLTEFLRSRGVQSALLNLGGNVQAIGSRPDGEGWRVAIKAPKGDGYAAILTVSDSAVVTSGGYERYFEADGVIYHHIIDPATGYPVRNGLASVTVVTESGLLADGLSTALYVMGADRAAEHWRANRDFEAVFITDEGELQITEGLESKLSLPDGLNAKVKVIRP